jgi:hypothetical protein
LLILTSGYSLNANASGTAVDTATSTEFVFVFDISTGMPNQPAGDPGTEHFQWYRLGP